MPHTSEQMDQWVKQIAQYATDLLPEDVVNVVIVAATGCEVALVSNVDQADTESLLHSLCEETKVSEQALDIRKRQ